MNIRKEIFRKTEIDHFKSFLTSFKTKGINILSFYGEPGIGKTTFRKDLLNNLWMYDRDKIVSNKYTLDFETNSTHEEYKGLLLLREQIGRYKFPIFDIAYSAYHKKSHPYIPLEKYKGLNFLDEINFFGQGSGEIVKKSFETIEYVPFLQWVPRGLKFTHDVYYKWIKDWLNSEGKSLLNELKNKSANEIDLSYYFCLDLKNLLTKSDENIVIFLDTVEALWETPISHGGKVRGDKWIKSLLQYSPSKVLWILFSRESLNWKEKESVLKDRFIEHEFSKVDEETSKNFLIQNGMENPELAKKVADQSNGIPIYLSLAVEIFQSDKTITFESLDTEIKNDEELLNKLLEYLNESEKLALKYLSIPITWNLEVFKAICANIHYPWQNYQNLFRFSFISFVEDNPLLGASWRMNRLIREVLYNQIRKLLPSEDVKLVHRQVFDQLTLSYRDEKLFHELTLIFDELIFHAERSLDANEMLTWLKYIRGHFSINGKSNLILTSFLKMEKLYPNIFPVLENGNEILVFKNEIATLYDEIGDLDTAEEKYREVIDFINTNESELGKNQVLSVKINFASFLLRSDKKEEARSLLSKDGGGVIFEAPTDNPESTFLFYSLLSKLTDDNLSGYLEDLAFQIASSDKDVSKDTYIRAVLDSVESIVRKEDISVHKATVKELLQKVEPLLENLSDYYHGKKRFYLLKGDYYYRFEEDLQKSFEYHKRGIQLFITQESTSLETAINLYNYVNVYWQTGDYLSKREKFSYINRSLRIYNKFYPNHPYKIFSLIIASQMELSLNHDFAKAQQHLDSAKQLLPYTEDKNIQALVRKAELDMSFFNSLRNGPFLN